MNAWHLFLTTDAGMTLAGVAFLIGYVLAWLLALVIVWSNLTRAKEQAHRLRLALRLREAEAKRLNHTIEEQTVQIGSLYQDLERQARHFVEAAGQPFTGTARIA